MQIKGNGKSTQGMSNTIEKKGTVQGKEKFGPSTLGPCIMF